MEINENLEVWIKEYVWKYLDMIVLEIVLIFRVLVEIII